jgi:hypothetical protein
MQGREEDRDGARGEEMVDADRGALDAPAPARPDGRVRWRGEEVSTIRRPRVSRSRTVCSPRAFSPSRILRTSLATSARVLRAKLSVSRRSRPRNRSPSPRMRLTEARTSASDPLVFARAMCGPSSSCGLAGRRPSRHCASLPGSDRRASFRGVRKPSVASPRSRKSQGAFRATPIIAPRHPASSATSAGATRCWHAACSTGNHRCATREHSSTRCGGPCAGSSPRSSPGGFCGSCCAARPYERPPAKTAYVISSCSSLCRRSIASPFPLVRRNRAAPARSCILR